MNESIQYCMIHLLSILLPLLNKTTNNSFLTKIPNPLLYCLFLSMYCEKLINKTYYTDKQLLSSKRLQYKNQKETKLFLL